MGDGTLWTESPARTVRPKNQWSRTPSSNETRWALVRLRQSSPNKRDSETG
jgi:hypothetical protein